MEIRILGRIALLHGGTEVDLGPRKQRLLLAALVVAPGRSRSIDRLVDDLWPLETPSNPKASLYAYVSRLRTVFEATADRQVIENTGDGYRLDLRPGELDADRFLAELDAAANEDDDRAALTHLDRAFARWVGDPFADLAGEHLVAETAGLLWARRSEAEEAYVHLLTRTDQAARAVAVAREIVARNPLDESAHWLVMFALDRAGRRAEALRHYVAARKMLLDEVGLEPGVELQRLERAILDSEAMVDGRDTSRPSAGSASRSRSSFVGRDEELAGLEALAFAGDRATDFAVIEGEAGIGKSRLLHELAESASARGAWVIRVEIQRGADRSSLLPLASALVRLAKEIPQRGETTAAGSDHHDLLGLTELGAFDGERSPPAAGEDVFRYRVTEALDRYLNRLAVAAPVLVTIDDAQWASPVLLDVLQALAVRPRPRPVSFVIATRGNRPPDAARALSRLRRSAGPDTIALGGLDAGSVAELATAKLGARGKALAEELCDWTQGNPFFVHEVLRVLDDRVLGGPAPDGGAPAGGADRPLAELALPASIFDAIHAHVEELSPEAIDVLQVAALIDGWFDPILCATVAGHRGQIADLVDQMLAAELVVERPDDVLIGFKHDLVRMSIRRLLSTTRQAEIHARIGLALAEIVADIGLAGVDADAPAEHGRSAELLAAAAHHLCAGAPFGTAVSGATYSLRAIGEARRRSDGTEARRLAHDALQALDEPRARHGAPAPHLAALRAELLCEQADADKWLLDHGAAHDSLREAFRIAFDHGLIDLAVRALRGFSGQMAQGWLGSWSYPRETIDMAERLVDAAGGLAELPPATAIGVLGPYSEAVLDLGDHDRADELTATAVALARHVDDRSLQAFAAERRLAFVDMRSRPSERPELCRLILAAEPDHPRYAPLAHRHLLLEALERGDRAAAEASMLPIDDLALHAHSELVGIEAVVSRTAFDLLMGNLSDAADRYERALERYGHLDVGRLDVLNVQLFWLQWLAGHIPDAEDAIRHRLADNETPSWKASLLLVLITQDRLDEVVDLANSMTRSEYTHIRESALQYYTPAVLTEAVAVLDDAEKASWLLPVLEPVADRVVSLFGGTLLLGWAALPVGRLHGILGNHCEAEANIEVAAARAAQLGSPLLALQADVARAELDLRRGRGDAARINRLSKRAQRHGFGAIAKWCRRLNDGRHRTVSGSEQAG